MKSYHVMIDANTKILCYKQAWHLYLYTGCLIPLAPPGVDIYAKPHEKWYIISLTTICGRTLPKIWDPNI